MTSFFNRLRKRAQSRHALDRLSDRQLRDINLERVPVVGSEAIYRPRSWNGL